MGGAQTAIVEGRFPDYLKAFFRRYFKSHSRYPCVIDPEL
jgi:hypothetical protein